MTYKVQLSLEAEKVFAKSNKTLAKKLARCFQTLEENPSFHPNTILRSPNTILMQS